MTCKQVGAVLCSSESARADGLNSKPKGREVKAGLLQETDSIYTATSTRGARGTGVEFLGISLDSKQLSVAVKRAGPFLDRQHCTVSSTREHFRVTGLTALLCDGVLGYQPPEPQPARQLPARGVRICMITRQGPFLKQEGALIGELPLVGIKEHISETGL